MRTRKSEHNIVKMDDFRSIVAASDDLRCVSLDDIVAEYGVSKRSLLRYVASGDLAATRFGRKYVVTISALKRFLASNRTTGAQAQLGSRAKT